MNELSDLSPPAAAVQRATEAGHGVLAVGRPWVQFEGFVLKESSGTLGSGWHLRYFVVSGDRLEYFGEERVKLELRPGDEPGSLLSALGLAVDHTNVVCLMPGAPRPRERLLLHEGDVIIGVNNEPCVGVPAREALSAARSNGHLTLVLLRPKGRIPLHGAAVTACGPNRKIGGHMLVVSDNSSRQSLVCADERLCAGWVASIKEAIAASAMEEIKTAISQALSLPALHDAPASDAPPPVPPLSHAHARARPASAPPQKEGRTPRRSASYNSNLHSLDERASERAGRYASFQWPLQSAQPLDEASPRTNSERQLEV